jgi:hypothetical protein
MWTDRAPEWTVPLPDDSDSQSPVPIPVNLRADWHDYWVSLEREPIPSSTTGYGYKVYYDSDASGPPYDGTGLTEGDSPIAVGDLTTAALRGLAEDTAYYATVTAYEVLGREGWYSNEVNNLAILMHYVYLPLVPREY